MGERTKEIERYHHTTDLVDKSLVQDRKDTFLQQLLATRSLLFALSPTSNHPSPLAASGSYGHLSARAALLFRPSALSVPRAFDAPASAGGQGQCHLPTAHAPAVSTN